MKRIITIITILLLSARLAYTQDIPFHKSTVGKDNAKIAQQAMKEGDKYMKMDYFYLAIEQYQIAYRINPHNSKLNYELGIAFLQEEPFNALTYIEKAYKLNPSVAPDILYYLGLANQYAGNFTEAIAHYRNFRPKDKDETDKVRKRISECEIGDELKKNPARAIITNVRELNSKYNEHSPIISADESVMYFTSTREAAGSVMNQETQDYNESIWQSYREGGKWTRPMNIGEPINARNSDVATVALSNDGQSMIVVVDGNLAISRLMGNRWSKPVVISEIKSKSKESSASFANNDRELFFISNRPGGIGGTDIWYSIKDRKGKWGNPINLGPQVNTPFDEESCFMHPDGRTLYFSSKGHNSMGGYDIFKTVKQDDGTWSKPENLGYPINTSYDDVAFVLCASGRNGYFSTRRAEGEGRYDICMVSFLGPEKPMILSNEDNLLASFNQSITDNAMEKTVELKTMRLTIVKGVTIDAFTLKPVEAAIEVVDNETRDIIFSGTSNSHTGKFLVSLPSGKNYGLAVKAEGYLFHSENFNIPAASGYQEIEKEIRLNKFKKDVKIILRNVFFDTGLATLKSESFLELNRLADMLKEASTLVIEISGHTDNQGTSAINNPLSKNRAKAVVDYLISQGIPSHRLFHEGYGSTQPVADNKTDWGRQQNRRVEFKVLSE